MLDRAHPKANAATKWRLRDSMAYITIMKVTAAAP